MFKTVEEIATGCQGADQYRGYAESRGFQRVETLDWTSSAGDWDFIVSKDGFCWQVLIQRNRFPRKGFDHEILPTVYHGTAEQVIQILQGEA